MYWLAVTVVRGSRQTRRVIAQKVDRLRRDRAGRPPALRLVTDAERPSTPAPAPDRAAPASN